MTDIKALKHYIDTRNVKKAAVIGGGFIGVETAENLKMAGLTAALVEGTEQIMLPFDYDMVQILHKEMLDSGVEMHLSSMLTKSREHSILIQCGGEIKEIEADAVVMAIGVSPETTLDRKSVV